MTQKCTAFNIARDMSETKTTRPLHIQISNKSVLFSSWNSTNKENNYRDNQSKLKRSILWGKKRLKIEIYPHNL